MDIIVSINKPEGITSQQAVSKVKKILNVKKAGHTGTLDPMATGLLLVCINKATRLASYSTDLDKEYRAVMKLGEATDTQDSTGTVISTNQDINVSEDSIKDAMMSFKGTILQHPPMFSALKHKGRSLYKYAREGIEIERKSREITIYELELLDISLPYISFRTKCSKGTYIRTLCHDIGSRLGTGAHMTELKRTAIGHFSISNSLTFEELQDISQGGPAEKGIYTMDEAMSWLPEFIVDSSHIKGIIHGNPIKLSISMGISYEIKNAPGIRIRSSDGTLLAIGSYSPIKNVIKMDVVLS